MLQNVPTTIVTFEQLEALAQDRKLWRAYQPCRRNCNTRASAPTKTQTKTQSPSPLYNLRQHKAKPVPPEQTLNGTATKTFPIFTTPKDGTKAKNQKRKTKPWSDRRRRAFALAHWQEHHGNARLSPSPSPTTTESFWLNQTRWHSNRGQARTSPPLLPTPQSPQSPQSPQPPTTTSTTTSPPITTPPTTKKKLPIWRST